jgi:hypothetical protein
MVVSDEKGSKMSVRKVLQELERRLLLAKGKKRIIGKVLFKMGILEREGEKRERERERDLSEK